MFSLLLLTQELICNFHVYHLSVLTRQPKREDIPKLLINPSIQVPRPLIEYLRIFFKCWSFLRMTKNTVLFCSAVALLILPFAFMVSPLFIFNDIRQHPWLSCALFAFGMLAACQRRRVAMLLAWIVWIIVCIVWIIVCRIIQKFRIIVRLLYMWLWGRL